MKNIKYSISFFGLLTFGILSCSQPSSKTEATDDTTCNYPMSETLKLRWSYGTTIHEGAMRIIGCKGILIVQYWDKDKGKYLKI